MADRQECVSIQPAESEHAESVGEFLLGMGVQELDLSRACVDGRWGIKNEDVDAGCACEGHERGSYDGGGEHRCESAPMDMAGIHKAVEGVLCKRNGTISRFICMKKVEKAARKTLSTGKPRSL